ncbi:acyltransferase family protein [Catellatospora coxensis]|uniref:Acyltransferase n=1 Tax=Catellatospora coxensis TaxID=310354 RepID=A0A8J3KY98_9ACTN|nr:acyltransferase [Catellatospora coxensis]GIG07664.1 acyltransferase [Catellatospora coxensis]
MTPLSAAIDPRKNSLNALRLLLAAAVIVSHAPQVAGWRDPYKWGDLEIGGWAVAGFFAISGWLITGSRLRLDMRQFLWNRVVRIYPGYWAALAVTAFLLAPMSLAFDAGASWDPVSALRYVVANATLVEVQQKIQHTLLGAPYDATWNLSLWTLMYEFACYVGVGVLLSFGYARRERWVTLAVFAVLAAGTAAFEFTDADVPGIVSMSFRLGSFFLAGAVLKRYADVIPSVWWLAAAATAVLGVLWATGTVKAFAALPLGYLTMYLGGRLPLHRIGRRNDISYGVYIYAFPLQQLLAMAGATAWGVVGYIAATVVAVVPFAAASWFLVEKPALRFKDLGRRGAPDQPAVPSPAEVPTPVDVTMEIPVARP